MEELEELVKSDKLELVIKHNYLSGFFYFNPAPAYVTLFRPYNLSNQEDYKEVLVEIKGILERASHKRLI